MAVRQGARIGVVVIGRNEGARLEGCLQSLGEFTQTLVYVDSGSTDGSQSLARKMGGQLVELDLSVPFTAARARLQGYIELKKRVPDIEFVQFVDGDCQIQPNWIETAAAFLNKNSDVAVVCGRRREQYPDKSIYNVLCDREWDTPIGDTNACGGNSLIRCQAYEEAGGFDGRLICGEEPELCIRLRRLDWKIWRLDTEMTLHNAAMTHFGQWWQRCVRTGYGFAEVSRLHASSPYGIWSKETQRAIFWGGLLPGGIMLAGFAIPVLLVALILYPLQIVRIAIREEKLSGSSRWAYAVFLVLGKFPELQGALKFYWRRLMGKTSNIIEYKAGPKQ